MLSIQSTICNVKIQNLHFFLVLCGFSLLVTFQILEYYFFKKSVCIICIQNSVIHFLAQKHICMREKIRCQNPYCYELAWCKLLFIFSSYISILQFNQMINVILKRQMQLAFTYRRTAWRYFYFRKKTHKITELGRISNTLLHLILKSSVCFSRSLILYFQYVNIQNICYILAVSF